MRVNDTLAVQLLQSRFRLMEMARNYPHIPAQLFALNGDVRAEIVPDAPAEGFTAVNAYFHSLVARSGAAGGYLRGDLPTTQYIEVAPNGETAWASYLTFGPHVSEEEPRQLTYCFGRYAVECKVEYGAWRIEKLRWTPVLTTAPTPLKPEENHAFSAENQQLWVQPPMRLNELRTTDEPESQSAQDSLLVENAFGKFLQMACAPGDKLAAAKQFFAPEATIQLGEEAPVPALDFIAAQKDQWLCLCTSRVIRPDGGDHVPATWASLAAKVTEKEIAPRWGRWYVDMERRDGRWLCTKLRWYTVAELEPWPLDTYDPAACLEERMVSHDL